MRNAAPKSASMLFFLVLLCLSFAEGTAQSHKVNLDTLLSETQKGSPTVDKIVLAWWIPQEYWEAALSQDPNISRAAVSEFLNNLKPYSVFMVIDGRIDAAGTITYKTERETRASLQLVDSRGTKYAAIPEASLDANTKSFLTMMKPLLGSVMGQLGQNSHFFIFPANNKERLPIMEPKKEGGFSLNIGEETLKWKLPLGSLLPPKICPVDGEELNGSWKYCPWHGQQLKVKP
jgi:hypothetical protein